MKTKNSTVGHLGPAALHRAYLRDQSKVQDPELAVFRSYKVARMRVSVEMARLKQLRSNKRI